MELIVEYILSKIRGVTRKQRKLYYSIGNSLNCNKKDIETVEAFIYEPSWFRRNFNFYNSFPQGKLPHWLTAHIRHDGIFL